MMIMNTMTWTNKKRTRRSSVVDPHRSSTRCWPRRGIVTPLDGVPDQLGQQIEHAGLDSDLARRRGNYPITVIDGLNYIIDRRII